MDRERERKRERERERERENNNYKDEEEEKKNVLDIKKNKKEKKKEKEERERERRPLPHNNNNNEIDIIINNDNDDDDDMKMFETILEKKKEIKELKTKHYTPAPRYGGIEMEITSDNKRAISNEIMMNRGLTAHRKKENKNPRVKKRLKYDHAVKARKGQVREVLNGMADIYGGEMTGIKANISRSRKIGN